MPLEILRSELAEGWGWRSVNVEQPESFGEFEALGPVDGSGILLREDADSTEALPARLTVLLP